MKKLLTAACAAVAMIVAAPALADVNDQTTDQQEETQIDTSTDAQGSEYTDPKSDLQAPAAGRTIEGEFVRMTGDQLWIRTGTGQETIQLKEDTAMPENTPQEGDRVIVSYERTSQGVMLANSVRAASPDLQRGGVTVTQSEQTERERTAEMESQVDEETESTEPVERERSQERVASRDRLPQTASELPLVALLGLLAIGGAVGIRLLR